MFTTGSDKAWDYFGKTDPYFGVRTHDSFRGRVLSADAKEAFFGSEKAYVDFILATLRERLGTTIESAEGLDFGCGVGRLTIPLSRACKSITGVDVSPAMLAEARKNCEEQGVRNATFVVGEDELSEVVGPLGFVHSFIVFQHIPPKRGEALLRRMIGLLRNDGVGVLHFTYSWSSKTAVARRLLTAAYERIPLAFATRNALKGGPKMPVMQMNTYDLSRLLRILHESGCHRVYVHPTETGHYGEPFLGAVLFFQKHRMDVQAYTVDSRSP